MKRRKHIAFIIVLSMVWILAACGGGTTPSSTTEEPAFEGDSTSSSPEKEVVSNESYLLEEGVISFALEGDYYPLNYINEATGELEGFDYEIALAIAAYHDWEPKAVATPWSGILSGLRSGNYDAIIGSMGITEERAAVVDFSQPYYFSGGQLFVRKGSAIRGIEDVTADTAIGVNLGTTYHEVAEEYTDNVMTYESDITALRDLVSTNNLDAVITDRLVGIMAIEETGFDLEMVGDLIYEEAMAIPVKQGNHQLLYKINEALAAIRADGTYEEISYKYFGIDVGTRQ